MHLRKCELRGVFGLAVCLIACIPCSLQATDNAATTHYGYPRDWSFRHLVMTGDDDSAALKAARLEPRHVYNMVMRRSALEAVRGHRRPRKNAIKVDWSVSLENGYVPANRFPALWSTGFNSENCNNDYMVMGLTVASGTQANLVGINNLYSTPTCSGTPWVSFAYNTVTQGAGQITTSPAISAFGGKVAFVETATAGSYFHVLVVPNPIPVSPLQTGTVLSPATPASCVAPTVAGCMTTVQISAGHNPTSPWIDYNTDTAYVGTDDGKIYKISPVFGGGAPVVVADADWPVTVSTAAYSKILTDPVVDDSAGKIFVGDATGYFYSLNLANPAHTTSATASVGWTASPQAGVGVVDPPFVVTDVANPAVDQVFAYTGCSSVPGIGAAITQLPANFTNATTLSYTGTVDLGSSDGNGNCTGKNVHSGGFDNTFWTSGSTTGHIVGCGFVPGGGQPSTPKMFMYPFVGGQLNNGTGNGAGATTGWVINNSLGDECSPLTEFFDGTTDRLFFGVGGTTDGYIKSSSITAGLPASSTCTNGNPTATCVTAPHKLGGTSGIIVDNQLSSGGTNIYFSTLAPGSVNGQKCNVAGGSANPYCAVKLTQSALQ